MTRGLPRPVIVEGVTGSGKSTLAQQIALSYTSMDIRARWYFELEEENPVLPRHHDRRIIQSSGRKWSAYLRRRAHQVAVFDARLLTANTVCAMQDGVPSTVIESRLRQLAAVVAKANPSLIYLQPVDIEELFDNTIQVRECADWYIDRAERAAYCRIGKLTGMEAVIGFHREVDRIVREVAESMSCQRLVVPVGLSAWSTASEIEAFLGLPPFGRDRLESDRGSDYEGEYRGLVNGDESVVEIVSAGGGIQMVNHPWTDYQPVSRQFELRPIDGDVHVVVGNPVEVRFHRNEDGAVAALEFAAMYDGRWPGSPTMSRMTIHRKGVRAEPTSGQ